MCVVLRIVNGLILRLSSSYVHFLIGLMGVFTLVFLFLIYNGQSLATNPKMVYSPCYRLNRCHNFKVDTCPNHVPCT
jgi:hypothetical protein